MERRSPDEVIQSSGTTAAEIRALDNGGYTRSQISKVQSG